MSALELVDIHDPLKPELLEHLETLKYAWRGTIIDLAAANEADMEYIDISDFEDMEQEECLYREALGDSDDSSDDFDDDLD